MSLRLRGYGLWVMGYGRWAVVCGLWVMGYGLWGIGASGLGFRVDGFVLSTWKAAGERPFIESIWPPYTLQHKNQVSVGPEERGAARFERGDWTGCLPLRQVMLPNRGSADAKTNNPWRGPRHRFHPNEYL